MPIVEICFLFLFGWNMTQAFSSGIHPINSFETDTPISLRNAHLKWQAHLRRVTCVDIHRCVCKFDRNMHLHLFTDPSHKHTHTHTLTVTSKTHSHKHTHTSLSDGVLKWHEWMTTPLKNVPHWDAHLIYNQLSFFLRFPIAL